MAYSNDPGDKNESLGGFSYDDLFGEFLSSTDTGSDAADDLLVSADTEADADIRAWIDEWSAAAEARSLEEKRTAKAAEAPVEAPAEPEEKAPRTATIRSKPADEPKPAKAAKSPAKKAAPGEEKPVKKRGYLKSPRASLIQMAKYALVFLLSLIFWEVLLYGKIHQSLSGIPLRYLLFQIPISLFLGAVTGWWRQNRTVNRIVLIAVDFAISIFYIADYIYFSTFGSLFSVSMMGMGGDAITNFWWSLIVTIGENIGVILVFWIPIFLQIPGFFIRRPKTNPVRPKYHYASFLAAVLCWLLAVAILPIGGKGDASAYKAYHSKYVDTDTASEKLGALTNTLVELKCSIFGSGETEDDGLTTDTHTVDLDGDSTTPPDGTDPAVTDAPEPSPPAEHAFASIDFAALAEKATGKNAKSISTYLAAQEPTHTNEYTGMFEGYNLIYICAESFSSYALNEKVTPTLCKLASEGIVLNNFYNSFKNTTTNGEYAFLTGLWPDVSREDTNMGSSAGSMAQSSDNNMLPALGNMFNTLGVTSRGYHNFKGSYYSRNKSLPNMGFTCKFMNAGMKFTEAWPSSDLEMMEQSVDDYINDDQFCAYYMTFSGHGSYTSDNLMVKKNHDEVVRLLGPDTELTDVAINYLSCNYELEKAMAYLLDRLEQAGKLENTVIVLIGDHYPYYLSTAARTSLAGETVGVTFAMYKSTCTMWCGGIKTPIQVDTPCCNVDILPTIYNLFNIPYDSRLYAGTDIFGDGVHIAQLYNKCFITDSVMYDAAKGKATWLIDTSTHDEETLNAYLENMKEIVKNRYSVSVTMGDSDYYKFVWANCADANGNIS